MNWLKKTCNATPQATKTAPTTSNRPSAACKGRTEGKALNSADELISLFDEEYKRCAPELVFEQGGYLEHGVRGWELYVPRKAVRLKLPSDTDKLNDINFGFYGMNRAGEDLGSRLHQRRFGVASTP